MTPKELAYQRRQRIREYAAGKRCLSGRKPTRGHPWNRDAAAHCEKLQAKTHRTCGQVSSDAPRYTNTVGNGPPRVVQANPAPEKK